MSHEKPKVFASVISQLEKRGRSFAFLQESNGDAFCRG